MKKLLLLPITLPLGIARGAVEGALRTAAEALVDLAGGGDDGAAEGPVTRVAPPPSRADRPDEGAVVDLDIAAAAPRRRPAARPPRPAPAPAPAPEPPAPEPPASPREVAEDLGLVEGHVDEGRDLVETEGAAAPGPEIAVDEPWPGYGGMRATDIVRRLRTADAATKAVVRLYEQQRGNRRTIIAATER